MESKGPGDTLHKCKMIWMCAFCKCSKAFFLLDAAYINSYTEQTTSCWFIPWRQKLTLYIERVQVLNFMYVRLCDSYSQRKMAKLFAISGDPDDSALFASYPFVSLQIKMDQPIVVWRPPKGQLANSADSGQILQNSVASDQGLQCL